MISSLSTYSQKVDKIIVIKDQETNLPIEDATVTIVKTRQNDLSNKDGLVYFELNNASLLYPFGQ